MTDLVIGALFVGLTGVVGALAAALALLLRTRGRETRQNERSAVAQWREIADDRQRQVERQQALIDEFLEKIETFERRHGRCEVRVAQQYGFMVLIYDHAKRCGSCLRERGQDPGELPPLPEPPEPYDEDRAEFERRTLRQKVQSVQQLSGVVPPPPPLPPAGGK